MKSGGRTFPVFQIWSLNIKTWMFRGDGEEPEMH